MNDEAEPLTKALKIIDLAGSFVSKCKMLSDKNLLEAQSVGEYLFGEQIGRQQREGWRELDEHDLIDPCLLETSQFFTFVGQKSEIGVRRQDFHWMRIKGEHHRRSLVLACSFNDLL